MFEYQYVTLYVGGGFWVNNAECEHRAIIDQNAAQGWRYVGYLPTRFSSEGGSKEIDLIFERPAPAESRVCDPHVL